MSEKKNSLKMNLAESMKELHNLNPAYAEKYFELFIEKARQKMKNTRLRTWIQLYLNTMFAILAIGLAWFNYPAAVVAITGVGAVTGKLLPRDIKKMLPRKKGLPPKE